MGVWGNCDEDVPAENGVEEDDGVDDVKGVEAANGVDVEKGGVRGLPKIPETSSEPSIWIRGKIKKVLLANKK